jgi:transcriptional regulator with AAA-type ATPase domain
VVDLDETEDDVSIPEGLDRQSGRIRGLELVFSKGMDLGSRTRSFALSDRRVVIGRRPGPGGIELADSRVSREHAEIVHDLKLDRHVVCDLESRNGTHVDGAKIGREPLHHGSILRIGDSLFVYTDVVVPEGLSIPDDRGGVSVSRMIAEASADLAAPTALTVLITGPTGSGKEVMAQRIHEKSGRRGPLVAVNCATFGRELIASELFGHEAGAFSGATSKRDGLFVTAEGGTLLLDEIGELPLEQQPALLRALQEKKVRPVGADYELEVDVRVVAATHQALDRLAARGAFRSDLHARLAGFVIELPGLLDRKEEIIPLFSKLIAPYDKPLSTEAAEALLVYSWPQNVRELKHAAERARLLSQSTERIEPSALPPLLSSPRPASSKREKAASAEAEAAGEADGLSKEELESLLRQHGGNVASIARVTGKHRQQIYRWLKRDGLDPKRYRAEE